MAKDWRPAGQRSPYEAIGMGMGKLQRPQERSEPAHVQGCGDPTCPICMPKNGRGGGAKMGGGGRWGSPEDARRALEGLFYDIRGASPMEFVVSFSGADGSLSGRPSQTVNEDAKTRRARDEERKLRGPVEKFFLKTRHGLAWDDVVGNDDARTALVESIEDPIRHAALYAHYSKKPTKGVLLYGPPGCGKTMFGKAAASVLAELHGRKDDEHVLLHIKGPEIQSPYVGVTEDTIRSVFAYARAYKALHGYPLVVFIDEADAILPSRDGGNGARRALPWEESNVATFLTEMDGLEESGALVILATNRPDAIDAAILRDGRCDRKIKVERPDRAAAETILLRALAGIPVAPDADRADLALAAAEAVFAETAWIQRLVTDIGARTLRLGDIVNGAMLVGLVERAKGNAFRRDLAAGGAPTGLTWGDLQAAVAAVAAENRGLNHVAAVVEMGGREGFAFAQPMQERGAGSPPPRYALDEAGEVVSVS